ncbi:MAG: hypothetical protein JWO56_1555 [Acidobacteria bacterium]|nr:hypothetical protein [Acidobacteriota bacterium]
MEDRQSCLSRESEREETGRCVLSDCFAYTGQAGLPVLQKPWVQAWPAYVAGRAGGAIATITAATTRSQRALPKEKSDSSVMPAR